MRGSTPRKRQKHLEISQKLSKNIQNYLYISIFLWIRTGEVWARPRRAETRVGKPPIPKTRMLGVTPSIFFEVDVSRKRKNRSLATPRLFIYMVGRRKTTNK